MPDCDGISLLKEWGNAGLLTMPVVMMSGHGTIDTAVEATRIGAFDFLEKPIALQKLLKTVNAALKHAAQMCKQLGKPCGIVGPNPEMVAKFIEYGYSWVAVASDMGLMVGRAQEWLGKLKGLAPAAPKAQGVY